MLRDLVRTADELTRKAPNDPEHPQVVGVPARTTRGFAGRIILTCTDFLRTFSAEVTPAEIEGIAACSHCDAPVPFWV
jgi:hypothetical protein